MAADAIFANPDGMSCDGRGLSARQGPCCRPRGELGADGVHVDDSARRKPMTIIVTPAAI
ncbi:hypothetical protein [Mesorhizobium sp. f-mel]